jgi:molybdate transport system substrate-binding protein
MTSIHVLSGGAAQGLVTQLQDSFKAQTQHDIDATFGAVGMMKDSFLAGTPCDVIILTKTGVADLVASGDLLAGSAQALGVVLTGIAVKTGEKAPDVRSPEALKAALRAANGIYFPDPIKATAGIHVMRVLKELGLDVELADRLRPYPNGATAMKAMAEAQESGLIGCTQITEILNTAGVELIAPLPKAFELATTYTAAVTTRSTQPQVAGELIKLLASPQAAARRLACGFEP